LVTVMMEPRQHFGVAPQRSAIEYQPGKREIDAMRQSSIHNPKETP